MKHPGGLVLFRGVLYEPASFTTRPAVEPPGPASVAFHSVASPHRSVGYASGLLGRETPQPQDLSTPRDGRVVNKAGWKRKTQAVKVQVVIVE